MVKMLCFSVPVFLVLLLWRWGFDTSELLPGVVADTRSCRRKAMLTSGWMLMLMLMLVLHDLAACRHS